MKRREICADNYHIYTQRSMKLHSSISVCVLMRMYVRGSVYACMCVSVHVLGGGGGSVYMFVLIHSLFDSLAQCRFSLFLFDSLVQSVPIVCLPLWL